MSKRVLFITDPGKFGSYYMRAETIAKRLQKDGYEAEIFLWHGIRDLVSLLCAVIRADAIISVKFFGKTMAPAFFLARKKIIYDCVDNFDFDHNFAYKNGQNLISNYVVNNKLHHEFVARKIVRNNQRVSIIEHHHSNFFRQTKEAGPIKTVGYIGNPHDYGVSSAFSAWCASRDIELYVNHSVSMSNEEAISENLKLDVYFMLLPASPANNMKEAARLSYVKDFKPAQKILLPFSLGIPTICAPYHAYFEAVRAAGFESEDFLFVETENELQAAVDKIKNPSNSEWLLGLIDRQKKVAENYHLDTVIEKYKKVIDGVCLKH